MKKHIVITTLILVLVLFFVTLSSQLYARSMIYDILAKGSQWDLNVDGETGTLELLGGRGSRTSDGGWQMTMEVKWQNNPGTLKAAADGDNSEQKVHLTMKRRNGIQVTCEGYIARETDGFMAGISRYRGRPKDIPGAWYAVNIEKKPRTRPPRERTPEIRTRDTEAPKAYIKVDGILTFTIGNPIKIRGSAEDNVKVARIHIYIDGRKVKSCEAWECWYSEILNQAGPHTCWAEAEDTAGNKGKSHALEFMVHPTSKPGPSLALKVQPYHPTSQDKVRFKVKASHRSGVESISIYIDNRLVKTCRSGECEYVGGPFRAGEIVWRASAKGRDGGINYGHNNTVTITPLEAGTCSISGKAYGSGANAARVFIVSLYGPNDLNRFRESKPFDGSGNYSFQGLPKGRYKLVVDTKADTYIGPHPSSRIVQCQGGPVQNINFELK